MSGLRPGLVSSSVDSPPGIAEKAWCDEQELFVELTDGRLVRHPLPDFVLATPIARRGACVVEDFGTAIWWPELDEGVGVNWIFGVSEDVIYDIAGFEHGPFPEEDASS
jgi:hypothetical protein